LQADSILHFVIRVATAGRNGMVLSMEGFINYVINASDLFLYIYFRW